MKKEMAQASAAPGDPVEPQSQALGDYGYLRMTDPAAAAGCRHGTPYFAGP